MKHIASILAALMLIPIFCWGQTGETQRIMVLPFRTIGEDGSVELHQGLAAVLGAEIGRDGDLEPVRPGQFSEIVKKRRVDPARCSRIARRHGLAYVVWGDLDRLPDGYSLDVWVADPKPRTKPKSYSITGANMEQIVERMADLAGQIGRGSFTRPRISRVEIEGNRRIQRNAILSKLELKPGTPFRSSIIGDEIREIYSMGFFDDVRISAEDDGDGEVELRIKLEERPSIKEIEIQGASVFTQDEILDSITTRSMEVASLEQIQSDIEKMADKYEKEGYYEPRIEYEIIELSRDEAKLVYRIDEGEKAYLTDIVFQGRKQLTEKELKKIMTIKEKSWIWFLDESGTFTREDLETNRMRLMVYYHDKGFIQVQIGAPEMDIDGGRVRVTYPIREGDRFQVRRVDVQGRDLGLSEEKLLSGLETKERSWYQRTKLVNDIKYLTRLYNNMGYAYVDVEPKQYVNDEYDFVDVTYHVTKGSKVRIDRVDIVGNERTRDKVIRRRLAIAEGDLYNADRIEASKQGLESLDFFETVQIRTKPGENQELMDIAVQVMEKKTGSLAAGLGYSTQDGAMGNINLSERNLLGLGIVANGKGNVSARKSSYEGSISYPWLFDIPLTATLRGYNTAQKEQHYVRNSAGMGAYFAYPIYGAWSLTTGFARDSSKLTRFVQGYDRSVLEYYAQYGKRAQDYLDTTENSVSMYLTRDTRNHGMIPSAGSKITMGSKISGLGGDLAYSRITAEGAYYQRLFWKAIMKVKSSAVLLVESPNEPIPFDQRLLLGGVSSVRGYQFGQIGPADRYGHIIGGDRSIFGNLECLFPLVESLQLNGVAFFDVGSAWNVADSPLPENVRAGTGVGIRWVSPMGPIRIEYGWKVDPRPGETAGEFAFAMGQLF